MSNHETCITLQMILVLSHTTHIRDKDLIKHEYNRYTLCTTPVSVERLQDTSIYKVKDNAILHRIDVYKLSPDAIIDIKCNPNNYIITDSTKSIEYLTKDDLEPYVLSDYDEQRLNNAKNKANKKQMFDTFILPQIEALANQDNVKPIYKFDKSTLRFNVTYGVTRDNHLRKLQNTIYNRLKAIGITSRRNYGYDIEILLTKTLDNLYPEQKA